MLHVFSTNLVLKLRKINLDVSHNDIYFRMEGVYSKVFYMFAFLSPVHYILPQLERTTTSNTCHVFISRKIKILHAKLA